MSHPPVSQEELQATIFGLATAVANLETRLAAVEDNLAQTNRLVNLLSTQVIKK